MSILKGTGYFVLGSNDVTPWGGFFWVLFENCYSKERATVSLVHVMLPDGTGDRVFGSSNVIRKNGLPCRRSGYGIRKNLFLRPRKVTSILRSF